MEKIKVRVQILDLFDFSFIQNIEEYVHVLIEIMLLSSLYLIYSLCQNISFVHTKQVLRRFFSTFKFFSSDSLCDKISCK